MITHVFINKEKPHKIKMIDAVSMDKAIHNLAKRLREEFNSGTLSDYIFGYYI